MRFAGVIVGGLVVMLTAPTQAQQATATRKRIAILDFDYSQVRQGVSDVFGGDQDLGKAIGDLLQTALVADGHYDVAPRQNVPTTARTDANGASQLAKQLNVDAVIMGSVTQYGKSDAQTGAGNIKIGGFGVGGIGKKTSTAAVGLTAQFISPAGPAQLATASGSGISQGSGKSLMGDVNIAGISTGGALDLNKGDYQNSTIGKATKAAVDNLVAQILSASGRLSIPAPAQLVAAVTSAPPVVPTAPPAAPIALPATYAAPVNGPFTWGMYTFQGGEHFRYNVSSTDRGQQKTGSYTIDATKQGSTVMLNVNGNLGADRSSATIAVVPGQGVSMMDMAGLGPAGILLFNPALGMYVGGRSWQQGTGWSNTQNGKTIAFRVESACSDAGVSGMRGVMRQNDQVLMDMCVSPNVGLPLAETFNGENGQNSFNMTLVEFHP